MRWLILLGMAIVVALPASAVAAPTASPRLAQTDERDRPKKERKRVRATLVPTTSSSEAEPAAEPEAEPAAEPEAEPAAPAPEPAAPAAPLEPTKTRDVPADGALRERIEVVEVLLDVLVTDREGDLARDLAVEDFRVTEDGRPVAVTSLAFYTTPGGSVPAPGGGLATTRTDRYFILFFHDQARQAPWIRSAQMDAARWIKRWVRDELQPNDQVAVLGYDVRLKVYEDFTRDADRILEAVDRAATGRDEPEVDPPLPNAGMPGANAGRPGANAGRPGDSPSLRLNLPPGKDLGRDTRVFEETLGLVARAAEGIVGRKNLLLFSLGFGETLDGVWTPDTRYYTGMEQSLNAGNVAVYPVDLMAPRRSGPAGPGLASSLSLIAADTGGLYYDTFVNFLAPLRRIAEDNQGYYLLSYRSHYPAATSGYREIEVEVPDHRGRVRYRRGYRFGDAGRLQVTVDR